MGVNLFISYAQEDVRYKTNFEKHLKIFKRNGKITSWSNSEIIPGQEIESEVNLSIERSEIIVLLISVDFINADYCYETEMIMALERQLREEAVVLPVIVRPCKWEYSEIRDLKILPENHIPISIWKDEDDAWNNICGVILEIVSEKERIAEEERGRLAKEREKLEQLIKEGKYFPPSYGLLDETVEQKNLRRYQSYPSIFNGIIHTLMVSPPEKSEKEAKEMGFLLVNFLMEYSAWYLSPLRIVKWGSKLPDYNLLGSFDSKILAKILSEMSANGFVTQKTSKKGNPLFRINQKLIYPIHLI